MGEKGLTKIGREVPTRNNSNKTKGKKYSTRGQTAAGSREKREHKKQANSQFRGEKHDSQHTNMG